MIRRVLALAVGLLLSALAVAAPAAADAVPYTDPSAVGSITLCNTLGQPMTHGNIHVKPFAWRAVGSAAAPSGYAGHGRTAALYGYQPMNQVDPSQWNGEFLTAGATYSNPARPMAAASPADPSLADLLGDYPPRWNGLIQLRMFVGAPGQPTLTSRYNAATLQISGDTWTLLAGGQDGCASGTSKSSELIVRSVASLPTPAPNATTDAPAGRATHGTGSTAKPGQGTTSSTTSGSASSPAASTSGVAGSAGASKSSSGGSSAVPWLVGALVVVAAVGVVVWRRLGGARR